MASTLPYTKDSDDITTSPAPPSDTYEAYKNNQGADIDPAEAKQTLKKIDTRIVPILFFAYLLQYLDKNGINYASAFGLQEGTNLKGQDYSWLGN
jgi:sugar phosphate permease